MSPAIVVQFTQDCFDALTAVSETIPEFESRTQQSKRTRTIARLVKERLIELGYLKPEKEVPAEPQEP